VDVIFSINFKLLEKYLKKEAEYDDLKEYYGTSINLSASGILVETKKVLSLGDLIAINLSDAEIGINHRILAIVRRLVEAEAVDRIKAGIQFIPVEDLNTIVKHDKRKRLSKDLLKFDLRKKQKLMQYVFNYQVKMRQKGLI
jgi:c-di-GMP-binding flagellar brake protein YcgR